MDSDGPKEACIRWGCTLAPPGKYHWTIHVWRRCGLLSDYFDPLLNFISLEILMKFDSDLPVHSVCCCRCCSYWRWCWHYSSVSDADCDGPTHCCWLASFCCAKAPCSQTVGLHALVQWICLNTLFQSLLKTVEVSFIVLCKWCQSFFSSLCFTVVSSQQHLFVMVALCNRADHYIYGCRM